jgi:Spy/CpxP family protein refolding chaperone
VSGPSKSDAEIRISERELQALMEDEKSDMSAIGAKVRQSEMLEAGLRVTAFKARRETLAILTPEQLEKATAAHEKRRQDMMRGYGHGSTE